MADLSIGLCHWGWSCTFPGYGYIRYHPSFLLPEIITLYECWSHVVVLIYFFCFMKYPSKHVICFIITLMKATSPKYTGRKIVILHTENVAGAALCSLEVVEVVPGLSTLFIRVSISWHADNLVFPLQKVDVTSRAVLDIMTKTTEYLQPNPGIKYTKVAEY